MLLGCWLSTLKDWKAATAGISRFRQVPSSAISNTGAGVWWGLEQGRKALRREGNGSNQYVGYWGRASGVAKSGPAAFLRPMLPTGMGLFNAVAAGYGFKNWLPLVVKWCRWRICLKQSPATLKHSIAT